MHEVVFRCGTRVTVENHGAGTRWSCPHCDHFTSSPGSNLGGVLWNHSQTPVGGKCPQHITAVISQSLHSANMSAVYFVDANGRSRHPDTIALGPYFTKLWVNIPVLAPALIPDEALARLSRELEGRVVPDQPGTWSERLRDRERGYSAKPVR